MAKYENYKANLEVLRSAPEQDLGNELIQAVFLSILSIITQ